MRAWMDLGGIAVLSTDEEPIIRAIMLSVAYGMPVDPGDWGMDDEDIEGEAWTLAGFLRCSDNGHLFQFVLTPNGSPASKRDVLAVLKS